MKVSTSTVAALFSKMALTGQRIAMVDMVLLVFQHFLVSRRVGWSQSFALKISFSCSLGGGGSYFSVPCLWLFEELQLPSCTYSRGAAKTTQGMQSLCLPVLRAPSTSAKASAAHKLFACSQESTLGRELITKIIPREQFFLGVPS